MRAEATGGTGRAIAVFARAPLPGRAKSRLIPALGEAGAAQLYGRLLRRALCAAAAVDGAALHLYAADREAGDFFARYALPAAARWSVTVQRGADLGARMADAFTRLLSAHRAAILIGSDIADLLPDDLQAALAALERGDDAVIAPSADGGYWLLGLRERRPELFADLAWGTDTVFAGTRVRLAQSGLCWRELPMRNDIDTPDDLQRCREAILALR